MARVDMRHMLNRADLCRDALSLSATTKEASMLTHKHWRCCHSNSDRDRDGDRYCGRSPRRWGWRRRTRKWPWWRSQSRECRVCRARLQPYPQAHRPAWQAWLQAWLGLGRRLGRPGWVGCSGGRCSGSRNGIGVCKLGLTVIRTTPPAVGNTRTMGHMHMRRRHTEQITGQLCRHLQRYGSYANGTFGSLGATRATTYADSYAAVPPEAIADCARRFRSYRSGEPDILLRPAVSACLARSGRAKVQSERIDL